MSPYEQQMASKWQNRCPICNATYTETDREIVPQFLYAFVVNKEITVKFMFYNEDVILECVTFNMTFKSIVPAATEEPDSAGSIVPSGTLVFLLCLSYPMIKYFL